MIKSDYYNVMSKNIKGIRLLFSRYPKVFQIYAASAFFKSSIPYIYLFLTARLINLLVEEKVSIVFEMVAVIIGVSLVLGLLGILLSHLENYYNSVFMRDKESIYSQKLLSIEFQQMDNPETFDLLSKIHMSDQYAGYGLQKCVDIYKKTISIISSVVGAVVLCASLFTSKVTNEKLMFLNSYLFAILLIIAMIFVSMISPYISNKAKAYWASKVGQAGLTNRIYSFYGFLAYDSSRAFDIRLYDQNEICKKMILEKNAFRPGGEIANTAKGYMGIGLALSVALSYIVTWIVYILVCMKAWAGAYSIGNIAQYLGALTTLASAISEILVVWGDLKTNQEAIDNVFLFMDLPDGKSIGKEIQLTEETDFKIEFEHVSFKYPNTDEWALNDVSCVITKGKHIAIVGENGSGKTTFVKLLCRLYEPTEGRILINGENVAEYNFESYIKYISVVFQDFDLIAQTIKSNIATSTHPDYEKLWQSIREADLNNYVEGLELKENTVLYKEYDTEGFNLSGGEEQKIAIARAVYKNAPIIILDEPTAALDPVSESNLYEKIDSIDKSKTMVFISHRFSSCIFCDEIMVFSKGKIVQQGDHHKLVNEIGDYQALWNAQAQYYK